MKDSRRLMGLLLVCMSIVSPCMARWKKEFSTLPSTTIQWYGEQRTTEAAEARMGFKSCCSQGDEYPTQFKVVEDGSKYGAETYFYFKDGAWLKVPSDIVRHEETPDGAPHIWLFPYDSRVDLPMGSPVCFVIPKPKG